MSHRNPSANLGTIARINGTTVTALARQIGRSRMQCYRAWADIKPTPTRRMLLGALRFKEVPRA